MCKRPSEYHQLVFVGKGEKDADHLGYKFVWDSSHPDLLPTTTVKIGGYGNPYCVYCHKLSLPIQAGLRDGGNYYETSGYTCICEAAEAEKQYKEELAELEQSYKNKRSELQEAYTEKLLINQVAILKMKQAYELKNMSSSNYNHSYFTSVNGVSIYQEK